MARRKRKHLSLSNDLPDPARALSPPPLQDWRLQELLRRLDQVKLQIMVTDDCLYVPPRPDITSARSSIQSAKRKLERTAYYIRELMS